MPALSTGSGSDTGLYELLVALPAQLQPHVDSQEDLTFLWDVFGEKSLHSLVKIHEKLHYYEKQNPVPILQGAAALADDLAEELQNKPLNSEIRELLKLLSKPNVKALLSVHDTVAQKNYDPVLPPMPDDIDDEEDSVKIIRLVKNREPLGATIKKDEQTGAIVVARIMRGGAADRSGLIHVGDELREVNGIPVEDKRPEEIIQILAQSQGAITFKIIPSIKEETPSKEGKMFIKALFDYDPNEDKAIPCKEAGLSFKKGDILQIMSQDDATWWQAKHEGDANPRAGLIPSKHFQERRLALRRPEILVQPLKVSSRKSSGFRRSFRLSRKDKKTNKSMYECKRSDQYDTADVPTYEEVTPYRRQTNEKYRLVVLVEETQDERSRSLALDQASKLWSPFSPRQFETRACSSSPCGVLLLICKIRAVLTLCASPEYPTFLFSPLVWGPPFIFLTDALTFCDRSVPSLLRASLCTRSPACRIFSGGRVGQGLVSSAFPVLATWGTILHMA